MKLPIFFRQLELGPMQNYVYLLGDPNTHEAAVVDAAWEIDTIVRTAEEDDGVMVLRFGPSDTIEVDSSISCEERAGDDW